MEINQELIQKAKEAKTPEELMVLAKENGIELTGESANTYFEQLHPKTGELSDEELEKEKERLIKELSEKQKKENKR